MNEPGPSENAAGEHDLPRQLRTAGTEELLRLLAERADELDAPAVRQALANPFATREVVMAIAGVTRLLDAYEIRRALAFHPMTPEVLALRFVAGLYWRDLMDLALEVRLRPPLRVAAERILIERLASLAEGEKMSLARRAPGAVLARLGLDPSLRVIGALLENPRLTEAVLYPLVRRETARPGVLALVADSPRWGMRYDLRVGLAQNPATPLPTALAILPHLKRQDLKTVAQKERLPAALRSRARQLLGTD